MAGPRGVTDKIEGGGRALSGKQLVALALFRLGAAEHAVDTEDLAIQVSEIAPGRFSWRKYPEQINLDAVRQRAADLVREDPPLAAGGVADGWMLTPAGMAWCAAALGVSGDGSAEADAEWKLLLSRTEAYRKFHEGEEEEITVHDARRFLRVDEYTTPRRRRERSQATVNAAAGDPALSALVVYLRARFPEEWR